MSTGNREYKSSVFTMLLEDKARALEVYNALNGTNYQNTKELKIVMLESAVYLSFKNDASFIIASILNMYEHQSTYNPNMPLRKLIYVANLYADLVKNERLYGKKLIRIPTPRFVTFYNGTEEEPERVELRLSDAFEVHDEIPQLELICTMININDGRNEDFMAKCPTLREYMIFVNKVRFYQKSMSLENALDIAIEECIMEHVLEEFMKSQKAQVKSMSVLEFNLERELQFEREEGREEGADLKIIEKICTKLKKGKATDVIADELEEDIEDVARICEVAANYAPDYDVQQIYEALQMI